ncbi:MAG: ATP-binding protein [Caldilineales bacterium]|nr:ATP-binding protein [Caldilineales bacterium]
MPAVYPFTAIVDQERMKRALILNAINPQIGGVLIRGERGTAKSTTARGLAALLPEIEVVEGCEFGCDPNAPVFYCTECQERLQREGVLPTTTRRIRFVDLPVSATEDRVVGTLDIEKAIKKGERHFEPGVLAAANRGLLYVDEVNLLDDHVVDLLLDSAAMGVNVVEREGISFQHPANFILVGTMNPEEGDLRPQLLDRFAHAVDIEGIPDAAARVEIVRRRLAYDMSPESFYANWREQEQQLSEEIERARLRLPMVTYRDRDIYLIAHLTASFNVDGHRADIVILKTAQANAAFEGRLEINEHDIMVGAELALPHRLKRQPFQDASLQPQQLQQRMEDAQRQADADQAQMADAATPGDVKKKRVS